MTLLCEVRELAQTILSRDLRYHSTNIEQIVRDLMAWPHPDSCANNDIYSAGYKRYLQCYTVALFCSDEARNRIVQSFEGYIVCRTRPYPPDLLTCVYRRTTCESQLRRRVLRALSEESDVSGIEFNRDSFIDYSLESLRGRNGTQSFISIWSKKCEKDGEDEEEEKESDNLTSKKGTHFWIMNAENKRSMKEDSGGEKGFKKEGKEDSQKITDNENEKSMKEDSDEEDYPEEEEYSEKAEEEEYSEKEKEEGSASRLYKELSHLRKALHENDGSNLSLGLEHRHREINEDDTVANIRQKIREALLSMASEPRSP